MRTAVERLVAAAEIGDAVRDGGGGMDVVLRLHLPGQLAGGDFQPVQIAVVRADEHAVAGQHRRRLDLALRRVGPDLLAGLRVDGVQHARQIADEDQSVPDGRRRLADAHPLACLVAPLQVAGLEIERDELAGIGADVDRPVGDGGRGIDRLARLERPEQPRVLRHGGRRDAGQAGGAAELRPGVRRGRLLGGRRPRQPASATKAASTGGCGDCSQ